MANSRKLGAHDLDCRRCGACCVAELRSPFYVALCDLDLERLTRSFREQHVAQASILSKVDPAGRCVCVALRGRVGRRVSCSIYPRRPEECRRLDPGSTPCLRARSQVGL